MRKAIKPCLPTGRVAVGAGVFVAVGSGLAVGAWVGVAVGEGRGISVLGGANVRGATVIASAGAAGVGAHAARVKRVKMTQVITTGQPASVSERCKKILVVYIWNLPSYEHY
jgi:hypothetical protein